MAKELPKATENKIVNQILKESLVRALYFAGCTTIIFALLFFEILGSPHDSFKFIVDLIFVIGLALLSFGFAFIFISDRKFNKLGIKFYTSDCKHNPFNYYEAFDHNAIVINPATGLPMCGGAGGIDAGGNAYGCKKHY